MTVFRYCIRINCLGLVPSMLSWHVASHVACICNVSGADASKSDQEYYWQHSGSALCGLCTASRLLFSWFRVSRNSTYLETFSSLGSFELTRFYCTSNNLTLVDLTLSEGTGQRPYLPMGHALCYASPKSYMHSPVLRALRHMCTHTSRALGKRKIRWEQLYSGFKSRVSSYVQV